MAESGKRVLLIDADFRRPRVHKLFGIENKVGLWQVIDGKVEICEATRATGLQNLWVMTSGGRPSNPAELLTAGRFKDFLDVVHEEYDFVIIDTPPVLLVTDACAVAPRVDAVLLVLRLTNNSRETSRQAAQTLNSLGARILGVVVNGLASGRGSGFGSYRSYGNRYSYSYQYGYGQQYSDNHPGEEAVKDLAEEEKPEDGPADGMVAASRTKPMVFSILSDILFR